MTLPVIKSHLTESLRHLHLPMFVTHYAAQAALATTDGWSYDRYLLSLCELELNQVAAHFDRRESGVSRPAHEHALGSG